MIGASALAAAGDPAYAQQIVQVPSDWDYAPGDLSVGDSFRLLFAPSPGHSFNDGKIQDMVNGANLYTYQSNVRLYYMNENCGEHANRLVDYDTKEMLIQDPDNQARDIDDQCYILYFRTFDSYGMWTPSPLRGLSEHFRVLHFGHSDRDDVRSHTYTEGAGVPIYWLGGDRIADNYDDFYSTDTPDASGAGRNVHAQSAQAGWYSYGISPIFRVAAEGTQVNVWPTVTISPSRNLVQTEGGNTRTYIHLSNPSPVDITVRASAVELGDFLIPSYREIARCQLDPTCTVELSGIQIPTYRPIGPDWLFLNPINAGDVQANRMILVLDDDNVHEPDGTITYTLLPGDGYIVGEPSTVTFTIQDNDPDPNPPPPPPQECTVDEPCVSLGALTNNFEGRPVGVSVYVEPPYSEFNGGPDPLKVRFQTSDSGRILDSADGHVRTFDVYGGAGYYVMDTKRDCDSDSDHWIDVTLLPHTGQTTKYQIKEGTTTTKRMEPNEHRPHPDGPVLWVDKRALEAQYPGLEMTEGDSIDLTGVFKSNYLVCPPALVFNYSINQTGSFVSSTTGATTSLIGGNSDMLFGGTISTFDDATDEVDGTITITLNSGTGYRVGSASTVTLAVLDDDAGLLGSGSPPPPTTVSIGISGGGSEGDPVSFGIGASPAPLSPLPVNVTLSGAGNVLNASDAGWRIVEIPPIGSYTLEVPTIDDGVVDVNNVTLTINPGAGYAPGQFASWTVDVQDAGAGQELMQPPVYDKLARAQDLTAVAIDPALVANVTAMANQTQHGDAHVERWNRVLAAFGEADHDDPTTAAEARANAEKYSSPLWPLIADALALLEAAAAEQDGPQTPPDVPDAPPAVDPELVSKVRAQAAQSHHGHEHVDRWNRVLAAFGEITHDSPTTAAEARANAEKYSSPLWPQIAEVLTQLESR